MIKWQKLNKEECKKVFKEGKILYKTKFGKNKASYAENYKNCQKKTLYDVTWYSESKLG